MQETFCAVSVGGNQKNSEQLIADVYHFLRDSSALKEVRTSSVMRTSPVSVVAQDPFVNGAAVFKTELDVYPLFNLLEGLEWRLGKRPKPKESSRPIDIDLIFYGNKVLNEGHLLLPHPRWFEREFVILPLLEIMDLVSIGDKSFSLKEYYEKRQPLLKGKRL